MLSAYYIIKKGEKQSALIQAKKQVIQAAEAVKKEEEDCRDYQRPSQLCIALLIRKNAL